MNKKYSISGMHCKSCEILIEDELKKISEVKKIKANFQSGVVEIFSNDPISESRISEAIEKAGYKIGKENKRWISRNPSDYKDLIISIVVLFILYLIINNLGFSKIDLGNLTEPSSLFIVLFVGLTAGVSTCMALVGGLVLGISARFAEVHPEASPLQKFRPHLFFNIGRIISFLILGGIVGEVGKAFKISNSLMGILIILVGLVMLVLGFQLIEIFPKISSARFTLPKSLSRIFGIREHHDREYSHLNSSIVGALTFFLPCGFTQAMQLYALSTGSFISGALIMSIFAIGTAPGLLGIGGLTSIVQGSFAKKFYKFAGILVIALALFNMRNGLNLTGFKGFNFNKNESTNVADPNVKNENGVQIAKMTQAERGYSPNFFQVKKGIPVKWIINSTSSNTCASALVSSDLHIDTFLKSGENIFEFTPEKIGIINFSCSMGMYKGKFQVTD